MEITNKTKRELRIQSWIFIILFLAVMALLGWLSTRYNKELDWTATGRHTLSEASAKVLEKLDTPVTITSYASGGETSPTRMRVRELLKRYEKVSDKLQLEFVDPMTNPDRTRELGIRVDGELVVEYSGRSEHITSFTETELTNALQRLMRKGEREIIFITGHGERNPAGGANHDLSLLFDTLKGKGFKSRQLNLTETITVPETTAVLVIASPHSEYLDGEIEAIKKYLTAGGNLLWLQEPQSKAQLKPLAEYLNISFAEGVVVDLDIQLLGVNDPTIMMGNYQPHAITENFNVLTLFPRVAGITYEQNDDWQVTPFLQSIERSWLETGELRGSIRFDEGKDSAGPITAGLAMTREIKSAANAAADKPADDKGKTQRIVVMGDGDFMSNAYLGNQGNQQLGENIINWLSHDDSFIEIPSRTAPDAQLVVNETSMILLGTLYLLVIPLTLIGIGVIIWLRRRKR